MRRIKIISLLAFCIGLFIYFNNLFKDSRARRKRLDLKERAKRCLNN